MKRRVTPPRKFSPLKRATNIPVWADVAARLGLVLFLIGIVVAVLPHSRTASVGAVLVVPAALCAVAAATITVVRSVPDPAKTGAMVPPEFAGAQVVMRNVWPLIVAAAGVVPGIGLLAWLLVFLRVV